MPDVTPPPLRSKANGIINFMGGLAYIVAMFGGAILYRIYPGLPFVGSALLLLVITAIFYFWIREPEHSTEKSDGSSWPSSRTAVPSSCSWPSSAGLWLTTPWKPG